MNIFFQYIFRKENLKNTISFPFSIHLQEKENLKVVTCHKRNSIFYFKNWDLNDIDSTLPTFKENETDDFVNYCFDNFNKTDVVNFSKTIFNRTKCFKNVTLNDNAFNYYYTDLLGNNIEELKYFKKNQLFKLLFKKQYESNRFLHAGSASKVLNKKDYTKWKLWEKYMITDMFPGEFIFHH